MLCVDMGLAECGSELKHAISHDLNASLNCVKVVL